MSPEQWLQQIGSEYFAKVQAEKPQFLIEIDVPDDRLEEIFNNISKARQIRWTIEQRLCLALAAVYSAAHADEGEGSFREVFYRRLCRPLNQDEWQNYYGPFIATFLKDWFLVDLPDSGPYRYVGSIYRHAGIPLPARSSFCQLLGHLWKGGVAFTRDQYTDAVQKKVSSTVARRFLESQAGYDFSQTTACFVVRWEHRQISAQELATFPSYRRSLYEAVLSEVQRTFPGQQTLISGSYPPPILALDSDTRRLVVKFDVKGVAAKVYRTNSGPVYYPTEPVSGSTPVQYSIKPETQRISVSPWWVPDGTTSALFRTSDGALVDTSRDVPAGTYYLVTSTPELVPPEIFLEESSPYLEHEAIDAAGVDYSILPVDLTPGCELPELSIRTKGTAAPPVLKFVGTAPLRHSLGGNIFVDRLPSLRILNWTTDCDNQYWLWINDGSGEKRIKPAPDGSDIDIRVLCPSQGRIWLESKYSVSSSAALLQLTFAVLPRGIDIQFLEDCCGIDEPAHLQVRHPSGWHFEPRTRLQRVRPDLWQISAGDRVVDATLSCGDLKFPISLRIPRVALWFNAERGDGSILWHEDVSHDLPMRIEGFPNTRCSILLDADGSTRTIWDLDLPASGTKRISSLYFRDALYTCGFSVAEFMLRLGDHTVISTGRYFASGDAIARSLSEEPVDSILFRLPNIGDVLLKMKRLFDEAPSSVSFAATMDLPHSLQSFICGLTCAAAEFDGSALNGAFEQYKDRAPDFILSVINWVWKVKNSRQLFGTEEELLATFPADDVAKLPVPRWREAVNQLLRHIQINQNVPELVQIWRRAVEDPDREHESELLKRPGGRALTDAARRYHDAFYEQGKARNEVLTQSIIDLRRLLNKPDIDPLVQLIAPAFLQLGYYHSGRRQDVAEILIPAYPLSFERLASSMRALAARCQGEEVSSLSRRGLGFADLSTRNEDALLERELENSSRSR